ncbi:MAG: PT domain-containing protein [Candidatus Sulfotelmatobacter sp.]
MEIERTPEPIPASEPASQPTSAPASGPTSEPVPGLTTEPTSVSSALPVAGSLPVPTPPAHADRSTGLVIFGVLQIILGLMAALMVPLIALGAFMSRLAPGGGMHPSQFLSATATYVFLAVLFVWLGVGSLRTKRWARSLTLVVSWYWMILGVLITVLLTAALPVSMRTALQLQQNAPGAPPAAVSTGVMAVILTIIIVFSAIVLVVVPIAFVVFYSREDVAATCRDRDPVEPWTDRTPLPVLGASLVFLVGALYLAATGLSTPVFPFFGRYLTGIPGVACFLLLAALDTYLAVALFRLKSVGWWIAVLTVPVRLFSMAYTYARGDLMQAYSKMGLSDAQLQMMQSSPLLRSHVILWWSLVSLVIFFGYLLWVKRYFKIPPAPSQVEAVPVQAG